MIKQPLYQCPSNYGLISKPAGKDFEDFKEVAELLNEEEKSPYVSQIRKYSNTFYFSLNDKDGFAVEKINIQDPVNQPLVLREKSLLEYSGDVYLSKEEALRINDCTLRTSFMPDLRRVLKKPN